MYVAQSPVEFKPPWVCAGCLGVSDGQFPSFTRPLTANTH